MAVLLRKQVDEKYKWKLEDIYTDDAAWEKKFSELKGKISFFDKYKGNLSDDAVILECLQNESQFGLMIEELYVFAAMRRDEDTNNDKYCAMSEKIHMLSVELSSNTSFIIPELMKMPTEKLMQLASTTKFANFSYSLKKLAQEKEHILSEEEEKILSEIGSFSGEFKTAFSMFDNADVKFKKIRDEDGRSIDMSHGVYSLMLQSEDRALRKNAYKSMFSAFGDYNKTLASIYAGNVKKNNFFAKIRKYDSALARAMASENVDKKVYQSLLSAVDKNIDCLHDYMDFRRKILGVDKLAMYDLHFSLVKDANIALEYEKAYDLVCEALAPLGDNYVADLRAAYAQRWIDVLESKGKRSGAYSWGTFSSHPYVLLNYQKTTHDIFTIAHEMGHALHSFYSNKSQCYEKASYEIFVAEVASTVNEILLLKHLIAKSDGETKKFLLCYYLDMFRTTLFRQTQFAEFEDKIHTLAQNQIPLTAELLDKEYLKITKKYYGKALSYDKMISYEWSRIPHFYNAFYVYKYATGIASAVVIADKILSEGESAVKDYFKFLKAGGSTDPVTILGYAGVDLTKNESFDTAFEEFRSALAQLKNLMM